MVELEIEVEKDTRELGRALGSIWLPILELDAQRLDWEPGDKQKHYNMFVILSMNSIHCPNIS